MYPPIPLPEFTGKRIELGPITKNFQHHTVNCEMDIYVYDDVVGVLFVKAAYDQMLELAISKGIIFSGCTKQIRIYDDYLMDEPPFYFTLYFSYAREM